MAQSSNSLQFGTLKEVNLRTVNVKYSSLDDWPKDDNGLPNIALVVVKFDQSIPVDEARHLSFKNVGSNGAIVETDLSRVSNGEIHLYVPAIAGVDLWALSNNGNESNRYHISNELEPYHAYTISLVNQKHVSILIQSKPEGMRFIFNNSLYTTPATIPDVVLGTYDISFPTVKGGFSDRIRVTEATTTFDGYDFREKDMVQIKAEPSNVKFYIDDSKEAVAATTIADNKAVLNIELPYGKHYITARGSSKQEETINIMVGSNSPKQYSMKVTEKYPVVFRTYFKGAPVAADIDIDNENVTRGSSNFKYTLPKGRHFVRASYLGHDRSTYVNVKGSGNDYKLKIKEGKAVSPWSRPYSIDVVGFQVGMVTKQWSFTDDEGNSMNINPFANKEGTLTGAQIGFYYQPCLSNGLGLYTGLFYEYYRAGLDEPFEYTRDNWWEIDDYGNQSQVINEYDTFEEHDIYCPIHVLFRTPLSYSCAVEVHGGIGLQYAAFGRYTNSDDSGAQPIDQHIFGKSVTESMMVETLPKSLDFMAEASASLRLGRVMLTGTYSKGLNGHTLNGNEKSKLTKMMFGITYIFQ